MQQDNKIETIPTGSANENERTITEKMTDGAKSAAATVSETGKVAAGKISEGAKTVGETIKAHPYTTAAAVGGVAAAAAGAVVGKKYYDKRKAKDIVDEVGMPEMRAGKPEVDLEKSDELKVAPTTN